MVVGPDGKLALPWQEQPLREALQTQRGHALLVQAAAGDGALHFMIALAQAWLCEAAAGSAPCGRCDSCRLLHAASHPDLYRLVPEAQRAAHGWGGTDEDLADAPKARKKPSRQIRIDELRAAIDWVAHSSSRGRAKVLLLHPAEAMNLQTATGWISPQFEIGQLGNCNRKGITDPFQARLARSFIGPGDLFQKIAPIRIIAAPHRTIRLAHQLGNQMQIPNRCKKISNITELKIGVDLLKICLGQAL